MTGFIIGLITTAAIIAFAEIFRKIDLKFFASLNLAVIPRLDQLPATETVALRNAADIA